MQGSHRERRRIKLPQPRLQFRMIRDFAGLAALALITQALVLGALLSQLAGRLPSDSVRLSEAMPGLLGRTLLLSALLVFPALILIGIRVTFRVAGPLRRFEGHLQTIASGKWPGPCRIRVGDELQDFCDTLNAGLEGARALGADDEVASPGSTENAENAEAA